MPIETNRRSHETVWTLQRIMSVAASLVMISALGIVSYHIGGLVPVAAATTPNPVNANASARAPAPAVRAARAALIPSLPEVSVRRDSQ
jgi:hypothetical protein